ncbi:MAG: pseudouridine synthase [Crocinitomicaceae bacterium]|nr:pseudouridine synthase [Crocinitomicaceae bacterium]
MSDHHYMLYKPYGFLSQFITNAQRKKKKHRFLGELYDFAEGTMSIGRLDEKSEGLLLLTTDGKVSNEITSKKYDKEYYVQLDGIVTEEALQQLHEGIEISINGKTYQTLPAKTKIIGDPGFSERSRRIRGDHHGPTSWASITINEGKYRQVRKMCAAIGFPVLRLIRVRIGDIELGDLGVGEVREVDDLVG